MSNKRNKTGLPESSSTRKRPPVNSYENPVKRQQLFNRLSSGSTNVMNESLGPQRTVEQTASPPTSLLSGQRGFFLNRNDQIADKLRTKLESTTHDAPAPKYNVDLKVVKDSDTQRKYLSSLVDYLTATHYDGSRPTSTRSLTSGQFQQIFKFLIHRVMPERVPKPKFEDDVLEVIRELEYPLVSMISPSSLRSIGALHTNPAFFALLFWLAEYCKTGDYTKAKLQSLSDGPGQVDQVFEDYATECYTAFMSGTNDFSLQNKKLGSVCDNILKEHQAELERIQISIETMENTMEAVDQGKDLLQQERIRQDELNRDITKFKDYILRLVAKDRKYENLNHRVQKEVNRINSECRLMKEEMAKIEEYWATKGITIEKIKQYIAERSELEMEINQVTEKYEETEKELALLETEIIRIRKELEISINEYNQNCTENMVQLRYNKDANNSEDMLNIDIKNHVMPNLIHTETKLKIEMNKAIEDTTAARSNLLEITEKLKLQEKELKEQRELLLRRQNAVKQAREGEQNRQNDHNILKVNNEQRRLKARAESIASLDKSKNLVQDKKMK
ncbi:HEC/Ndc80p family-domain-containing protein [Thamnidium elegans]|nr:HEC/Ndc80p family-domain-containing protein [Thamnidium elegans]